MTLQINGKKIGEVRYGEDLVPIGEARVWDGAAWKTVYTSKPTVVITGGGHSYGARNQFRAALTDYGLDYRTVTELPFKLDTSQVTNMFYMFSDCSALTSVPDLDTSNVTNMSYMFYSCSALTSVPDLDTSNVTNMSGMFRNMAALTTVPEMDTSNVTGMSYMFRDCSALTSVPDMDTSNVTSMSYTFHSCSALTDGNVRLIGKNRTVGTTAMILNSGLTREPFYDTNGNPI